MALALYRKYRPRTFAEVIGQEHVTEPLSQALRSGRLNHAYLFSGPRGCGKTSSARILARSLNCEQGPTPEPCGRCDSCRSLSGDGTGSIDVIEIDAASHGGVDDARELRERAFFAPASSRFKIYVIDEAHMVSSAGFNALLKLVEEPPEYVKFIFATTEPEKVLGTIRSRTHHYPFRLIPPKVLRPYLEQLCEAEGATVDPAVFPLVVRAGGGSARDSLSVLDQLIAGAGPEGVSYARAAALLGVTDSALIDEMCDALAAGDGAAAYATVDRVAEAGHDARRFASDLLERLRDLIVIQQVPDAAAKGLIDGPTDQIERMAAQAQRLGPGTLSRCADIVHNGLVDMRGTTAPRLLLELICARMLLPGVGDSTGGLLQRLERMERRLAFAGTDAPPAAAGSAPAAAPAAVRPEPAHASPAASHRSAASTPPSAGPAGNPSAAGPPWDAPPAAAASGSAHPAAAAQGTPGAATSAPVAGDPTGYPPAPGRAGSASHPSGPASAPGPALPDPATPAPPRPDAAPGALDAVTVRRAWPEVVAKVNRVRKPAAALMRDAVVRDVDGDTVVLTVKSPVLAQMMGAHTAVLADALYEEFGGRWQIRCEVAGERGATSLAGPRPAGPPPARSTPEPPPVRPTPEASSARPVSEPSPSARPGAGSARAAGSDAGPGPDSMSSARSGSEGAQAVTVPGAGGSPATTTVADEEDWPEAARPGGATAPAVPAPSVPPTRPAVRPSGPAAAPLPAAPGNGGAPVSSAIAAARAAAAGRGPRTPAGAARTTADSEFAGEPPYDPDYDGPGRGDGGRQPATPTYEGFDPGDEPGDEVLDERTARQSSEEQAVQLLREAFGAEKIDEVDAR